MKVKIYSTISTAHWGGDPGKTIAVFNNEECITYQWLNCYRPVLELLKLICVISPIFHSDNIINHIKALLEMEYIAIKNNYIFKHIQIEKVIFNFI